MNPLFFSAPSAFSCAICLGLVKLRERPFVAQESAEGAELFELGITRVIQNGGLSAKILGASAFQLSPFNLQLRIFSKLQLKSFLCCLRALL